VDIGNSEALFVARKVDPQEQRTIAVVTKSDLATSEEFPKLLNGKGRLAHLKMGIVAVINRTAKHDKLNISVDEIQREEREFFAENFPDVAEFQGTPFLQKKLQKLLSEHILDCSETIEVRQCIHFTSYTIVQKLVVNEYNKLNVRALNSGLIF